MLWDTVALQTPLLQQTLGLQSDIKLRNFRVKVTIKDSLLIIGSNLTKSALKKKEKAISHEEKN